MKILRKASALQNHLSTKISNLCSSTTLIISSSPAPPTADIPRKTDQKLKSFHNSLEQHVGQCHFFTRMQFNMKTVTYGGEHHSLSSAYPTEKDVNAAIDMLNRAGATNIIGVGSGAAIDLAKVCFSRIEESNYHGGELMLYPSTLGATLASTSRECLILSPEEEALLPYSLDYSRYMDSTTVIVDDNKLAVPSWIDTTKNTHLVRGERGLNASILDASLSSLVIALDTAYSLGNLEESDRLKQRHTITCIRESITNAMKCIEIIQSIQVDGKNSMELENAIHECRQYSLDSLISSGQLLSFGRSGIDVESDSALRRNVCFTLTSSLLPKYFPYGNWCTFTASLLPGLCHAISDFSHDFDSKSILQEIFSDILQNERSWKDGADPPPSSLSAWINRILIEDKISIPKLSSLVDGAPDTTNMISSIEDNAAFLECIDADTYYIERLLNSSLDR